MHALDGVDEAGRSIDDDARHAAQVGQVRASESGHA
jgi:hypothetical protein